MYLFTVIFLLPSVLALDLGYPHTVTPQYVSFSLWKDGKPIGERQCLNRSYLSEFSPLVLEALDKMFEFDSVSSVRHRLLRGNCVSVSHYLPFLSFPRCYLPLGCTNPILYKIPVKHFWSSHHALCYSETKVSIPETQFYRAKMFAHAWNSELPISRNVWYSLFPSSMCYARQGDQRSLPFDCSCLDLYKHIPPLEVVNSTDSHLCYIPSSVSHCPLTFVSLTDWYKAVKKNLYVFMRHHLGECSGKKLSLKDFLVEGSLNDIYVSVDDYVRTVYVRDQVCINMHEERVSVTNILLHDLLRPLVESFAYLFMLFLDQVVTLLMELLKWVVSGDRITILVLLSSSYVYLYAHFRSHFVPLVILFVAYVLFFLQVST